jgi:hypothetical protein
MRRICIIMAALAAIVLAPTTAYAASIHRYRVADIGDTIRHAVTVCHNSQYRWLLVRLRFETELGEEYEQTESLVGTDRFRVRPGCWRLTTDFDDSLGYEGRYDSRVHVTIPWIGFMRWSGWKSFYAS